MSDILYRSSALEVRMVAAGNGRRQVVTFDSYHEPPGLDRPGFGEAFFKNEEITAVHVLCHGNDWFQYPEIFDVLSLIRRAGSGAERLLAYGSSMGGYAALRFAARIGAHASLALSPQYSADRRKVPFEKRWAADRRRIRFQPAIEARLEQVPLMVVAYDPRFGTDAKHAQKIQEEIGIVPLPLPFAGHPAGPFLQDVQLLRPLVLDVLGGCFDPGDILLKARHRARLSPHWLANVAEHHPRARGTRAVALARRAVSLASDRPNLHDILARALAADGRHEEAIAAHRDAIAIEPIPDYLWGLSKTLHAAGDLAGAIGVADRIRTLAPRAAGYHAWVAKLREEQRDWPGAIAALRDAVRHDRGNMRYRTMAASLRWRSGLEWLGRLLRR